ncbi:MAG: class I SAM-dependent methyltransferase [Dehalococcoidia bacterium]
MPLSEDAARNRAAWDRDSDSYQARHGSQLNTNKLVWGTYDWPEETLGALGDLDGKTVLELGCGAAQWAIRLASRGVDVTGLDNSARQLEHARSAIVAAGLEIPLVHASAEDVPLPDRSFDVIFCDHGGMSFGDPYRTVPEAARLLRPDGLLVFNTSSPLLHLTYDGLADRQTDQLQIDYFGLHRIEDGDRVEYQLPYGEWIRLFRRSGFVIEDLIELQAPEGGTTTYGDFAPLAWTRRWPAENIWKVRREP